MTNSWYWYILLVFLFLLSKIKKKGGVRSSLRKSMNARTAEDRGQKYTRIPVSCRQQTRRT